MLTCGTMRLWSFHPSHLDRMGLVALWREGLLAQKVLRGKTKGYRHHPQLNRFRATKNPVSAIGAYLSAIAEEAKTRGYVFNVSKIVSRSRRIRISVSVGQLEFERKHLTRKLRLRDPAKYRVLKKSKIKPHPMMQVVAGGIEPWEII
jgi:hypothetical protein